MQFETGRHRRNTKSRAARFVVAASVAGAGVALPFIGSSSAQAASVTTWDKLAQCESSGNWNFNGEGLYGGLQFIASTWNEFGGTQYASTADQASKSQQIAVAERVLTGQGPGAWPQCSVKAGLTSGGKAAAVDTGDVKSSTSTVAASETKAVTSAKVKSETASKSDTSSAGKSVSTASYKILAGDTLSRIATAHAVEGGWRVLYETNQSLIGSNPNLIRPGQSLSLSGAATSAKTETSKAQTTSAAAAKAKAAAQTKATAAAKAKAAATAQAKAKAAAATKAAAQTKATAAAKAKAAAQTKATAAAKAKAAATAQAKAKAAAAAKTKASTNTTTAKDTKSKTVNGTSDQGSSTGYVAPVSGAPGGSYGRSGSLWSKGHTGEDFRASSGTSVRSITSGTVVSAGWAGAYGNEVVIRHADGKYSQYGHLSSISVSVGQKVGTSQKIALSGSTGNSTGPHLHFEVRTTPNYGSAINPLTYLRANGVSV